MTDRFNRTPQNPPPSASRTRHNLPPRQNHHHRQTLPSTNITSDNHHLRQRPDLQQSTTNQHPQDPQRQRQFTVSFLTTKLYRSRPRPSTFDHDNTTSSTARLSASTQLPANSPKPSFDHDKPIRKSKIPSTTRPLTFFLNQIL